MFDFLDRAQHHWRFDDGLTTKVLHQAVGVEIKPLKDRRCRFIDGAPLTFADFTTSPVDQFQIVGEGETPPQLQDTHHLYHNLPVTVPWIQMRGRWLAAAGFAIGAKVRVRVRPGRLVLTVEEG